MSGAQPMHARFVGYVALTAAIVAFAVHLSAIAGAPFVGIWAVLILFPLGFACWATLIRRLTRGGRVRGMSALLAVIRPLPVWARALFGASFFYTLINFLVFFQATGGGTIEHGADGRVVLSDHGRVIRTLDEAGVREIENWQLRLFSGHILPFLLLPGLYFVFAPKEQTLLDAPRRSGSRRS